jgi:hypothetical protein
MSTRFPNFRSLKLPVAFLMLYFFASHARAGLVIYDALAEFGITNNPNGVWTYGYSATPNTGFTVFPNHGIASGGPYWTDNTIGLSNIAFWRNDTWVNGLGVPPGPSNPAGESWLVMHPGPGAANDHVFLRFTAPTSGPHSIDLRYLAGDNGAVQIWMLHNGDTVTPLFDSGVTGAAGTYNSQVSILSGDTIDLVIGNAGSHFFDSTPVRLTITSTPIPEPGTGLFILLSLLTLGVTRQHRNSGEVTHF